MVAFLILLPLASSGTEVLKLLCQVCDCMLMRLRAFRSSVQMVSCDNLIMSVTTKCAENKLSYIALSVFAY